MSRFAVILPAAGRSSRFGGKEKKTFATIDGRAVWLRAAELFVTRDEVAQTLLVLAPDDIETFRLKFTANIAFMDVRIVPGGAHRFESIANALQELKPDVDFVAVHDAVRPCAPPSLIDALFAAVPSKGAVIPAIPVADTLKQADADRIVTGTMPRKNLWLAQTPQVFRKDWLLDAYARRAELGTEITDDAQLVEAAGHKVHLIEGDPGNIKITTRGDIFLADAILKSRPKPKPKGPSHPFADEDMWR